MENPRRLLSRIPFYGWVMVAVAGLVILAGAGTRAATGAFLLDIRSDTGWSTGDIGLAGGAGLLLLGLGGPLTSVLVDRAGVRRVTVGALLLASAGMAGSALAREVWQLVLLFGCVAGLGAGLVASSLGPIVASRWFVARRGLVVGIFGASASAGQLIFFPVLTAGALAVGWRWSSIGLAVALLVAAVPALLLLREAPSDVGQRPLGATDDAPAGPVRAEPGVMRRAIRTPTFWLLAGTFFVCGATSNGVVGTHFIAHAADHGFAPVAASGALALMGGFNFVGTLASGWLTDRYDPRRLLLVYYVFRGVSLLYLPALGSSFDIVAFAVLFGLDYIATVPPTVALCADTFGRRNVGIVYGWVYASHMLGAALAAWGAGVVRDNLGDYALAYLAAAVMAGFAGVAALAIRRHAHPAPLATIRA